jgi:uroporphyrinogen decarboxylase
MARRWMKYLTAQLELGVDGMIDGVDFAAGTGPMISPKHFRQFIQPYLKMYAEECHKYGVPFIKHEDGNIEIIEKDLLLDTGIDAYHAIEPVAGMDIGRLKRQYGDKITLMGNVDCSRILVEGSKQEIREATADVIRQAAPGGGFVLTSSNSIHDGVPLDRFLIMLEAGREFGQYPIAM